MATLEERVATLEGVVEKLVLGFNVLNSRLDQATRERNEIKDRLDTVETKIDGLETKVDAMDAKIDRVNADVQGLRKDLPGIVGEAVREALRK